jgi:hypothetical protein
MRQRPGAGVPLWASPTKRMAGPGPNAAGCMCDRPIAVIVFTAGVWDLAHAQQGESERSQRAAFDGFLSKPSDRMSSTPASKAASLVFRSPRRVSPRTGSRIPPTCLAPNSAIGCAPSRSTSSIARCGCHSLRAFAASVAVVTARVVYTPWLSVNLMSSMTTGRSRSMSTLARPRGGQCVT